MNDHLQTLGEDTWSYKQMGTAHRSEKERKKNQCQISLAFPSSHASQGPFELPLATVCEAMPESPGSLSLPGLSSDSASTEAVLPLSDAQPLP